MNNWDPSSLLARANAPAEIMEMWGFGVGDGDGGGDGVGGSDCGGVLGGGVASTGGGVD